MEINVEGLEVSHNEAEKRFEIWIDGYLSQLDYRLQGNTIVFYYTGVPALLEGQGIAGRLTQTALDYAEEKSLNVVPLCSYVAAYIRRHPQHNKLVKPND
jgi:predicted GNAT family acetyltransferase